MSRLIDADKLKQHYAWWEGGSAEMTLDEAKKTFDTIIDVQPTVDIDAITESHEKIGYDKGFRDGYAQATVDAVPTEFHDKCMEIEIQKRMDLELNAERVVRCKDCIYYGDHGDGEVACAMMILYPNKPTDYCSLGERKEDVNIS